MSIAKKIYDAFKGASGIPVSIISLMVSLWAFHYQPDDKIPAKYAISATCLIVVVIITLINLCVILANEPREAKSPKVIQGMEPSPLYAPAVAMILLDKSELLGQDSTVSIYKKINGIEILIGWGIVTNIQQDRMIQVTIKEIPSIDHSSTWAKIKQCDRNEIDSLVIKPSIPHLVIDKL